MAKNQQLQLKHHIPFLAMSICELAIVKHIAGYIAKRRQVQSLVTSKGDAESHIIEIRGDILRETNLKMMR